MKTKTTLILMGIVILLAAAVSLYAYPRVPDVIATHWSDQNVVDGTMGKFWGLALMPLMLLGIGALLMAVPHIDPLRKNIEAFRPYFNTFVVIFALFMLYMHVLTVLINMGNPLILSQWMMPGMGLFIFYTGVLMQKAKRNFFIGIRTPWTLSSDSVWEKTHRLGGWLFKAAGIITMLGIIFPSQSFLLLMVPMLAAAFIPIIYSYFAYQREMKGSSAL